MRGGIYQVSIVWLNGSAREGGNTEALAKVALEGLDYQEIALRTKQINPILDQRHVEGGFQPVDDDYEAIIQEVLQADALVVSTPVYWYSTSGSLKNFIDRWSQSLRSSDYDFKQQIAGKKVYVIVVGGDNPRIKALPLIQQLNYTFDFAGLSFEAYIIGKASKPGDIWQDERALLEAKWLNGVLSKGAAEQG